MMAVTTPESSDGGGGFLTNLMIFTMLPIKYQTPVTLLASRLIGTYTYSIVILWPPHNFCTLDWYRGSVFLNALNIVSEGD